MPIFTSLLPAIYIILSTWLHNYPQAKQQDWILQQNTQMETKNTIKQENTYIQHTTKLIIQYYLPR